MVQMYSEYTVNNGPRDLKCNVLAYVTPWNSRGYDVAKEFMGKFTHISPVWLNLEPDEEVFKITGTHDVDQGWMDQVRGIDVAIVPRIMFSKMSNEDYISIIKNETVAASVIDVILETITKYKFNGVVLELGVPIKYMQHLIQSLSKEMKLISMDLEVFVVIPPFHSYHQQELVTEHDIKLIIDHVDGLSLMTYDYTISPMGGPNAPIEWMADNVARLDPHGLYRSKILLGINLYGYDYSKSSGRQDVVGSMFIDIIKKNSVTCTWSESDREHVFEYDQDGETHLMYYPTLPSLNERIKLAENMGTGISFWEIGQGQDAFYELL